MFGINIRKSNKKGSLMDIMFLALFATVFAIVVLFGLFIASTINDEINERTDIFDSRGIHGTNLVVEKYKGGVNSAFLFLVIGVGLVSLVLAALVRVHPIFIPLFFVGWIAVIFMSGIFSNIYQAVSDDPNMAATTASLSYIDAIMTTLPIIIGIFGILLMFVMYKLWSMDQ